MKRDLTTVIVRARLEHARLRRIISDISAAASNPPSNILALLDDLADALRTHLQLEDEYVYPALCGADAAFVRRKARRYQRHMSGIAEGFAIFYRRWTSGAEIELDVARFREDWRVFESALLQRIESEDHDLYPAAIEGLLAGLPRATRIAE